MRPVDDRDIEILAGALEGHERVLLGYLHGSVLEPDAAPNDLDVAVVLDLGPGERASTDSIVSLQAELEEQLSLQPVDLRVLNESPLYFQALVAERGRCVFERQAGMRAAYEGGVLSEYLEFAPVLEQYNRAMVEQELRGFHGR